MSRKSLPPPPPPSDPAPNRSPAPLPPPVAAAARPAGRLPPPPPPVMRAAPAREPLRLPEFRRWHLYTLLGVGAAVAAGLWLPGLWMETVHRRPSEEWARAMGRERLPAQWDCGGVTDFQVNHVDILRVEPGRAVVNLTGTATLREPLYTRATWRDALTDAGAPLDAFETAQNQARTLRWDAAARPAVPDLGGATFLRASAPAGKAAAFHYDFQAERDGTRWRVGREIGSALTPTDAFPGDVKQKVRASAPVFLDTEEGRERVRHLAEEMQHYVAQVEAEKQAEPARVAHTSSRMVPAATGVSTGALAPVRPPPAGFTVAKGTVSPDGRYGVLAPDGAHYNENDTGRNQLVEIDSGRLLATLPGDTWLEDAPAVRNEHLSRFVTLGANWSLDGSTLSWAVGGKWVPGAFSLLRVKDGNLQWQVDVYKAALDEILQRARNARPTRYQAVRARQGAGTVADGFMVDVQYPTRSFSLPLQCKVTLTSNPKAMPDRPPDSDIDASMVVSVSVDGEVSFASFAVDGGSSSPAAVASSPSRLPPITSANVGGSASGQRSGPTTAQRLETADQRLNAVYAQLRSRLDERRKAILKQDEIQWLKRLDVIPKTDPRRAEMIERRTEELSHWQN